MKKYIERHKVTLDWVDRCKKLNNQFGCSIEGKHKNGRPIKCDKALCLETFREVFYNIKEYQLTYKPHVWGKHEERS
jgi:hypothetical protein